MFAKLKRFIKRNEGDLLLGSILEAKGRLFKNKYFRKMARVFYTFREPDQWVFVMGNYNSGTTLLRDLLGAHPRIATLPFEGVTLTEELTSPEDLGWTRNWVYCRDYLRLNNAENALKTRNIKRDWAPFFDKHASIYLEKSISNVERIEWLCRNFSNVSFIGISRDGYASCEGMKRKAILRGQALIEMGSDKYDNESVGLQWAMVNEVLIERAASMDNFTHIKYEDLVANPRLELQRILESLGVSSDMVSESSGGVKVASSVFEVSNQNENSYKKLSSKDYAQLNDSIANTMLKLGYEIRA